MLTTAAETVPPASVLVLGAGAAGLQAIATARRLGAIVTAYDVRPEIEEQMSFTQDQMSTNYFSVWPAWLSSDPHLAAIFGVGLVGAFLLRRSRGGGGTAKKIVGLVVFAAAAGVLMSQLQTFFELEQGLDVNQVFAETTRRTSQGGSQFQSTQPTSPIGLPWAVITVLFRPFLYEAGGAAGIISALETPS